MLPKSEHCCRQKEKLSSWILDYDKNAYCDPIITDESRDLLIDSFNECSDLRRSFHNSLNEFFCNLGFSSMENIHKYGNSSFSKYELPMHPGVRSMGCKGEFLMNKNNSYGQIGNKRNKMIKNKIKKGKNKNKKMISLKKRVFMEEIGNYDDEDDGIKGFKYINQDNDINNIYDEKIMESNDEDSEHKKDNNYKHKNMNKINTEEQKDNQGDYLLNSIFNQFGFSYNKDKNKEKENENKKDDKKEGKTGVMKEKNKYNEKISNIITEPKIISKEYKSKKNDYLFTSDKDENEKEKAYEKNKIITNIKDSKEKNISKGVIKENKKIEMSKNEKYSQTQTKKEFPKKEESKKFQDDDKNNKIDTILKKYKKEIISNENKIKVKKNEEKQNEKEDMIKKEFKYIKKKNSDKEINKNEKIIYNKKGNIIKNEEDKNINF